MSKISHLRTVMVMGASVAALGVAAPALAQETVTPPAAPASPASPAAAVQAGQSASDIGTVIVTAERRAQNVQKVPVAVSAYTSKQRDTIGILTLQDMTNFTPGMTYSSTTDHLYLRGVGRQTINLAADAGVAAYSDGFYNPDPVLIVLPPMFVGTTDILRGPQGTLFGRNGIGGAIQVDSVRPTSRPYAEVRATFGNYGVFNGEAAISGPIVDGVNFRVAGFSEQQNEGYFTNVAGGPSESGAVKVAYLEGSLSAKIGDNADLYVHAFTFTNNSRGGAGARAGWDANPYDTSLVTDVGSNFSFNPAAGYDNPNNITSPFLIVPGSLNQKNPSIMGNPAVQNHYNFSGNFPLQTLNRNDGDLNAIFTYHFPTFDVKYTGGYQQYTYQTIQSSETFGYQTDVNSYQLPASFNVTCAGGAASGCLTVFPTVITNYTQTDAWYSHELNFSSTDKGPVQWIGGLYYYNERYTNPIAASMPGQAQVGAPVYLGGTTPTATNPFGAVGAPLNPQRNLYYSNYNIIEQSEGIYGQVDWKITDTIKLTGGVRFTDDQKAGTEELRYVMFGGAQEYAGLAPVIGAAGAAALTSQGGYLFGSTLPAVDFTTALCATEAHLPKGVTSQCKVNPNTGIGSRSLSGSSDAVTGTAGVEWTPDSSTLAYARYSRGYKELGFNAGFLAASPEVAPELMNDYEIGLKKNFGRNFLIDAALFYEDYDGVQVPVTVVNAASQTLQSNLLNISKARSDGVELEAVWTPVQHLQFLLSYAFNDTAFLTHQRYVDTVNPNLGAQSIYGNPLPNAARNKVSLNSNYTWVFDHGDLTLSGTYLWRDTQTGAIFDQPYWTAPSWSQVDLRATWRGAGDRYEIVLYGANVFNTTGYPGGPTAYQAGNATTPTVYAVRDAYTTNPPATYGVEVHYKFF
jgi:iron complex outermembrane recepter protein